MQQELNILPIQDRLDQINCNIIIKTMYSNPRILTTEISQSQKSDYLERILALLQEAQGLGVVGGDVARPRGLVAGVNCNEL